MAHEDRFELMLQELRMLSGFRDSDDLRRQKEIILRHFREVTAEAREDCARIADKDAAYWNHVCAEDIAQGVEKVAEKIRELNEAKILPFEQP